MTRPGGSKEFIRRYDFFTAGLVVAAGAAYFAFGPSGVVREYLGMGVPSSAEGAKTDHVKPLK